LVKNEQLKSFKKFGKLRKNWKMMMVFDDEITFPGYASCSDIVVIFHDVDELFYPKPSVTYGGAGE